MAHDFKSFLNAAKKSLLVDGHAGASGGISFYECSKYSSIRLLIFYFFSLAKTQRRKWLHNI
ncbi:MAG: hypothetical protein B7X75_00990 [Sphingobacteriales bacterium 39-40-5]|nr:MAG: hypothetical protein B7Y24_15365 [Sphingobacteriales bacterium 16-39-50]OZA61952.1 MAG: hypothetical protein B7X75_00990 [Sphingobacteriales bacterium 39-40-5]